MTEQIIKIVKIDPETGEQILEDMEISTTAPEPEPEPDVQVVQDENNCVKATYENDKGDIIADIVFRGVNLRFNTAVMNDGRFLYDLGDLMEYQEALKDPNDTTNRQILDSFTPSDVMRLFNNLQKLLLGDNARKVMDLIAANNGGTYTVKDFAELMGLLQGIKPVKN